MTGEEGRVNGLTSHTNILQFAATKNILRLSHHYSIRQNQASFFSWKPLGQNFTSKNPRYEDRGGNYKKKNPNEVHSKNKLGERAGANVICFLA
jgi:hypothetical protein